MNKSLYSHKSVTLLFGGNDIDDGQEVEACRKEYENLITTTRRHNPNATINILSIPPRDRQDVNGSIGVMASG